MKSFFSIYVIVHIFPFVKPLVLFGNGAVKFIAASQDVIDSPTMPQQVKPIFQDFIVVIPGLNTCVAEADLQCILDASENTVTKGIEKAVSLTDGQLQKLFRMMLNFSQHSNARLRALPKDAGHQAVQITDTVFANEANWIQQYLQKSQQPKPKEQ